MRRFFTFNIIFAILLNLLIKPIWIFGIDRTIQNIVGYEQYGNYFALLSFSTILNILLDFGITSFNTREISQNRQFFDKYFSNIIFLKFFLASVYFIITLLLALFVGYSFSQLYILILLVINQFFSSMILYFRSNLTAMHLFYSDSIISVTDKVLMIFICIILFFGQFTNPVITIEWFVYIQMLSYLITLIAILFIIKTKIQNFKIKIKPVISLYIIKKSWPYAVLILLMSVYLRIDSVLLERILPDGVFYAGVYAQVYRIYDAISIIPYLFAGILIPVFARMIKQREDFFPVIHFSLKLILIPAILIVAILFAFGDHILSILYHRIYNINYSYQIIIILSFSFLAFCFSYISGALLTADGKIKQLITISFYSVLINCILNIILIPKIFALGCAIAILATQLFTAVFQFICIKKYYKMSFNHFVILKYFICGLIILGLSLLCKWLINNWIFAVCIFLGFYFIIIFVYFFSEIKKYNLKQLLSKHLKN